MARGHHNRGGGAEGMGRPMSYTASNNVEKEAEGEERRRGGRTEHEEERHEEKEKERANGGIALKEGGRSEHKGKHHIAHNASHAHVEHHHYRKGGHVPDMMEDEEEHADGGGIGLKEGGRAKKKEVEGEGHKMRHRRLDRPGRKRGGGVGADKTPLTTAATVREGEAHRADNDELEVGRASGGRAL